MRILYINFDTSNSRDTVTISGLRQNGVEVVEICDKSKRIKKFLKIRKAILNAGNYDMSIVGYTGNILVPFVRIFTRKKVVYNALASFYESMIISREAGKFSLKAIWYYIIDFLAFHSCSLALVESEAQKEFISRIFLLSKSRISVHLTGVDEHKFYYDPCVAKLSSFTVLFRGKFLPEAGVSTLIEAAKLLEDQNINIRIIGQGFLEKEIKALISKLKPKNLELITEFLPIEILRTKMLECHLSIGQLADHPRLERTIPHKAFESLSMKLPYLTAKNKGVLEILKEDETCVCVNPNDSKDLADKIMFLKNNPETLERISANAYGLYESTYTPLILGRKLLEKLNKC